jgi:glutathione transport system substrate-binding protein
MHSVNRRRSFYVLAAALALAASCSRVHPSTADVTIMQTEAPRTMDPADHTETYTTAVLDAMYEGLTRFNQQLEIVPALATGWQASADGMTWTANLRANVRFHDGTPLNAAAVVASFNRLIDVKRGLAGASHVRRSVESVQALDPLTVRFHLKAPFAAFPRLLAVTSIVSPSADHDGYLSLHAVGTGPYRFAEWKTGEYVREVRNEDYWGKKLRAAELRWMWSSEPALMNMAVLAGEVDLVNPLPPIFADALRHNNKVRLLSGKSSAIFWVSLNTHYKPLSDVRVRRALNYATDRASLVRSQLRGYGLPANSPLAPAVANYDTDVQGYSYDPTKARALLAEAGYPDGFPMNMAVLENQVNFAEVLQSMWQQVHVTLTIQRLESGVFSQIIFGTPEQKAATHTDSVFASWASPTLDAERQLGPLYRTKNWSPTGANVGFYSNPKVDQLLDQAAAELDPTKQHALYKTAQEMISSDAPHVLLYSAVDLAAARRDLSDLWIFPGGQVELVH